MHLFLWLIKHKHILKHYLNACWFLSSVFFISAAQLLLFEYVIFFNVETIFRLKVDTSIVELTNYTCLSLFLKNAVTHSSQWKRHRFQFFLVAS